MKWWFYTIYKFCREKPFGIFLSVFAFFFTAFVILFFMYIFPIIRKLYELINTQFYFVNVFNDSFQRVSLSIGGSLTLSIALLGVILTLIRSVLSRQQNNIDEQRVITEQISRAIDQIGSYKYDANGGKYELNIEARLGGLYSLQRIMRDSLKDENAIAKIFYAYVRENTKRGEVRMRIKTGIIKNRPREDVQAALDIVNQFHKEWRERRKEILDDIQINFARSNFSEYSFLGMDFSNAILNDVDLSDAKLNNANLSNAKLNYADLSRAKLSGAKLSGANLLYADLTGTDLHGVDLSKVLNLTQNQVNKANGDEDTTLPKVQGQVLELPEDWIEPEPEPDEDE